MSLRIAHITDERYPSPHTDCQQVIKTADALGAVGCEVHLIQPRLAVHYFKSRDVVKAEICRAFNVDGRFEVRDIRHFPGSDLRIEKLPHALLGPLKALVGKYDVVHTRNIMTLAVGAVLGLPVLYEDYKALPITTPRIWQIVRRALSRPGVLGLVTHSAYSASTMIDQVSDSDAIVAIENGYDPKEFEQFPLKAEARERIGLTEKTRLAVYTGHIRAGKGISTLVDLAEDVPSVHILLVGGTGDEASALRGDAEKRRIGNLTVIPRVKVADVPLYLAAADVLLLPTAGAPMMKAALSTVMPMKVYSYLAAGRPILAPDLPDTVGVLTHDVNCLKVSPDDREAAATGLNLLLSDKKLAVRLSARAAKDAKSYTWEARARRLVTFMEKRLNAQSGR